MYTEHCTVSKPYNVLVLITDRRNLNAEEVPVKSTFDTLLLLKACNSISMDVCDSL